MPESTKYTGNPFISRRERQASVVLYNLKSAEKNKEADYQITTLAGVKLATSFANAFTTSGSTKDETCTLYVELRDGNPGYVNQFAWDETKQDQWTIQPGKDYFVANGQKFVIQSLVERKNIRGGVDILEVVGK